MKVKMSPEAIEKRLKLVGELTRACLLLHQNALKNQEVKSTKKGVEIKSLNTAEKGKAAKLKSL